MSIGSLENTSRTVGNKPLGINFPTQKAKTELWFSVLLLSILVVILYAPVLGLLAKQWWEDPNYGHGFFVPLFAAYVLWHERENWNAVTFRPNNFGFAIMLLAIGLLVLGTLGAELFIARLSLLILVSGVVIFLAGCRALWTIAFPIGYLIFMIPLPAIVYFELTFPLQLLASRLGASGLIMVGIRTVREGNLLILPNCTLNVVEACSGIRSLLSLLAAVVAYMYVAERSAWRRAALSLGCIPVAIAVNGLRLVVTGVLSFFFGPTVDFGVVHLALGLGFFALAFVSILLIHKVLCFMSKNRNPAPICP